MTPASKTATADSRAMYCTPTVSVLMSVKDGMPYVPETVASIKRQSFPDWEFVIVDNGSTDGSYEYLQAEAAADPRIVLMRNEGDTSQSGGLNRGLEACRGDWVARIDADDRALPQRLEKQLAFVAARCELVAISCYAYYIGASGGRIGLARFDPTSPEAFRDLRESDEPIVLLHPGVLMRREAVLAAGRYRSEFGAANDIDLWSRLAEQGMLLVQSEPLMEYRIHQGATMTQEYDSARLKQEWARACMMARRSGQPEPTFEMFKRGWDEAPLWRRINRRRRMAAELLCRRGREDRSAGRSAKGMIKLGVAALLRPGYTLPRLKGHLRFELQRVVAARTHS